MTIKPKHRGTTGLFAQPIGKGLNNLHQQLFDKSTLELIRLGTHWPQVVGSDISAFCRPIKLHYSKTHGSLHINAYAAIALELQHMQPILLERISQILGHSRIQRIQFVQGG